MALLNLTKTQSKIEDEIKATISNSIIEGKWWNLLLGYHTNAIFNPENVLLKPHYIAALADVARKKLEGIDGINEIDYIVTGEPILRDTLGHALTRRLRELKRGVGRSESATIALRPCEGSSYSALDLQPDNRLYSEQKNVLLLQTTLSTGAVTWMYYRLLKEAGAEVKAVFAILRNPAVECPEELYHVPMCEKEMRIEHFVEWNDVSNVKQRIHSAPSCTDCPVSELRIPNIDYRR